MHCCLTPCYQISKGREIKESWCSYKLCLKLGFLSIEPMLLRLVSALEIYHRKCFGMTLLHWLTLNIASMMIFFRYSLPNRIFFFSNSSRHALWIFAWWAYLLQIGLSWVLSLRRALSRCNLICCINKRVGFHKIMPSSLVQSTKWWGIKTAAKSPAKSTWIKHSLRQTNIKLPNLPQTRMLNLSTFLYYFSIWHKAVKF